MKMNNFFRHENNTQNNAGRTIRTKRSARSKSNDAHNIVTEGIHRSNKRIQR